MFAARNLAFSKSPTVFNPSDIAGYLATFDTLTASRILNGSDTTAAVGEAVKRWNSDNAAVYFSQATAALRPELLARGIRSIDTGDLMVSTGIGTTEGRTVVILHEDATLGAGAVNLFDGDTTNSFYLTTVVTSESVASTVFNHAANVNTLSKNSFYSNYANIVVARKASDKAGLYTEQTTSFTNNLAYTGSRASTALNLFSKGNGLGQSASGNVTIVAMVIFDGYLSDSDALKVVLWMRERYSKYVYSTLVNFYDVWGQSNASGRASTTGVTDFDAIDPNKALMLLDRSFSNYDFGVNHNTGCDATTVQFGSESELLRLATLSGGMAAVCKYGVGGTGLYSEWLPTAGSLYVAAFERTRSAQAGLISAGFQVYRRGLLWLQGEKDAAQYESANYSTRLQTLVANYRSTYGASLPVAVVKIKADVGSYPDVVAVQAAQAAAVAAMGNAILIDTTSDVDFPRIDGVHFAALAHKNIAAAAYAFFNQ